MAAKSSSTKLFNDPIHGSIELDPLLVKIIDTPQFQRLRKIKQLGGACYVYPGAVHTRFDHSIGVCHIAGEFIERLQRQAKDVVEITDKDVLCVKIAALCHDLGHGPFSHLYDKKLKKKLKEQEQKLKEQEQKVKEQEQKQKLKEQEQKLKEQLKFVDHEYRSVEMFNYLFDENKLDSVFEEAKSKLEPEDKTFIGALITFVQKYKKYEKLDKESQEKQQVKPETAMKLLSEEGEEIEPERAVEVLLKHLQRKRKEQLERVMKLLLEGWKKDEMGRSKEYMFLFEIVANGLTGIDVDKMDYFARDSHGLGLPNRFDWRRYIQTSTVREENGVFRIATREKSQHNLCELFHTRYVLHRTAYKHKTVMIIEDRIGKAIEKASEAIEFRGTKEKSCNLFECAGDMEAFTHLSDSVLDLIMLGPDSEKEDDHSVKSVKSPYKIHFTKKLKEAKEELRKIDKRALPKCVGKIPVESTKDPEDIVCNVKAALQKAGLKEESSQLEHQVAMFTSEEEKKIGNHVFFSKYAAEFDKKFPIKGDEMLRHLPGLSVQSEVFFYYYRGDDEKMKNITGCINRIKMETQNQGIDEANESMQGSAREAK